MIRKEIIIFFLILIIICAYILIRKIFVTKGERFNNLNYKSENVIIQTAKEGGKKNLVILGSGFSLSIDEYGNVINHDPFMILPSMKQFSDNTTVMSIFYPFESKGLEEAGIDLSNFINLNLNEYENVTLIGHSKCGVCFANLSKWIKRDINVVTISTPYTGTPVANGEEFAKYLNSIEEEVYVKIFSDHNVDKDLVTDSNFMKNADYSGLNKCKHINIVSTCPENSLNPIDMFLIYMDTKGVYGDGIAPKKSQQIFLEGTIQEYIQTTHATSLEKGIEIAKKYIKGI